MPAFIATVEGEDGRVGDVYFVKHAINARRAVCDYWQDGELNGAEVRRAPQLDKYEEQGWVPITDMIYAGWWAECYECGIRLTDDYQYDEDDNEFILNPDDFVGVFNGQSFCCQECHDTFHRKRHTEMQMKGELLNMMQAKLEAKFGVGGLEFPETHNEYGRGFHCNIKWTNEGTPFVAQAQLNFKVPGCEHGGLYYRLDNPQASDDPTYELSYAQGDHDAIAAFFLERTGRVLDKPKAAA